MMLSDPEILKREALRPAENTSSTKVDSKLCLVHRKIVAKVHFLSSRFNFAVSILYMLFIAFCKSTF
jgi:hypothetical protein